MRGKKCSHDTVPLTCQEKCISLFSQFSTVSDCGVGQCSSDLGRQLTQEKLNEQKIGSVLTQEIQHTVHELRRFAITQSLEGEKPASSLSVGQFKGL